MFNSLSFLATPLTIDLAQEAQVQGLPFSGVDSPGRYVGRILAAVMAIAALLVLFALVTGAMDWITSGGDKGKLEKAREKMTQAVIGIIVLAATLAIFGLVQSFVGIDILNFSGNPRATIPVDTNPRTGNSFAE